MAVKFEMLKVGDKLYSSYKRKMGNTTMKTLVVVTVTILEIYPEEMAALVKFSVSPSPFKIRARELVRLSRTKPYTYTNVFGQVIKISKKEFDEIERRKGGKP